MLKYNKKLGSILRIAVCGASGFIGTYLSRALVRDGYEVVRVGREHFKSSEALQNSLDSCDAVINLCGAPIIKKWNETYKNELYISRIETTKKLLKAISNLEKKPSLFMSASAVGIYKEDLVHDDNSQNYGTNYISLLVQDWEREAKKAEDIGLRCTVFRLGIVLGKNGGAVSEFKLAFKIGLGAIPGDGKQPFSWIHIDDVVEVIKKTIQDTSMRGAYNLTAPESVQMKTFMKTFGKAIKKPVWLNVPEKIIKIRYAEGAESLLKGSFVVPSRLENEGYTFKYANLDEALTQIIHKKTL